MRHEQGQAAYREEVRGGSMKSCIIKRSVVISHHKTSVSLEDAFWAGLKEIAKGRRLTLSEMVSVIETGRTQGNLSSAIRLFVLDHFRNLMGAVMAEPSSHPEKPAQERDPAPLDRT
jgi:predicted DNA-binding ribbon-helix-helix protein